MIPATLSITIPGRPVPKKNSPVMIKGRNLILPSKAYRAYHAFCIGTAKRPGWLAQWGNIQFPSYVSVKAHYWLPDKRWWPDLTGLLQATGDILQAAAIIRDDKFIVGWPCSRIVGLDRKNPRAEITIYEAAAPEWGE